MRLTFKLVNFEYEADCSPPCGRPHSISLRLEYNRPAPSEQERILQHTVFRFHLQHWFLWFCNNSFRLKLDH